MGHGLLLSLLMFSASTETRTVGKFSTCCSSLFFCCRTSTCHCTPSSQVDQPLPIMGGKAEGHGNEVKCNLDKFESNSRKKNLCWPGFQPSKGKQAFKRRRAPRVSNWNGEECFFSRLLAVLFCWRFFANFCYAGYRKDWYLHVGWSYSISIERNKQEQYKSNVKLNWYHVKVL